MKKLVVRGYQRGNPRQYKNCRLDPDTHENLQKLSKLWSMSFLQVLEKLTVEALAKEANEQQKNDDVSRF